LYKIYGYYPFYIQTILNIDAFADCYKEFGGYFFDNDNNAYKSCFNSCKTCLEGWDTDYNNGKELLIIIDFWMIPQMIMQIIAI